MTIELIINIFPFIVFPEEHLGMGLDLDCISNVEKESGGNFVSIMLTLATTRQCNVLCVLVWRVRTLLESCC